VAIFISPLFAEGKRKAIVQEDKGLHLNASALFGQAVRIATG
jgi:hypothetical protein